MSTTGSDIISSLDDQLKPNSECEAFPSKSDRVLVHTDCEDGSDIYEECSKIYSNIKTTTQYKLSRTSDMATMADSEQQSTNDVPRKCEPCCNASIEVDATSFCEVCEELLCEKCTYAHAIQKATKSHKPIDVQKMKPSVQTQCDICLFGNISNPAENFCEKCSEAYCRMCCNNHNRQKATKDHLLVPISKMKVQPQNRCDICLIQEIENIATNYCTECKEYLCNTCNFSHINQKATKHHKVIDAAEASKPIQLSCDICEDREATVHCKDCSEGLCDICASYHKKQKMTTHHNLVDINDLDTSTDMVCSICESTESKMSLMQFCNECEEFLCQNCSSFHKRQKVTRLHTLMNAKDAPKRNTCDPCSHNNKFIAAAKICKDCEIKLCSKCANTHRLVKATKQHQLFDVSESDISELCEPCRADNTENEATSYCKQCEELLCRSCESQHTAEKTTRSHELLSVEEASVYRNKSKSYCEICKYQGKSSIATSFCKTCAEPELMCSSCANNHIKLKINRSHQLANDLSLYKVPSAEDETKAANSETTDQSEMADADLEQMDKKNKANAEPLQTAPEKPQVRNITADSLELFWTHANRPKDVTHYQIRIKNVDTDKKWSFLPTEFLHTSATISHLQANAQYVFQVRAVYGDEEGPYSPCSDEVFTLQSPATRLVNSSVRVQEGTPAIYALPLTEYRPARNPKAKTRKFDIGAPPLQNIPERIMMLVGATGTGKSTLVDGIINYILGVKWNDPFRYTIVNLEEEEAQRKGNQALSQTEWITCYTINPERGGRLDYKLTIIDTPGFGDTRGLDRDNETVEQIRQLFSAPGKQGVVVIDAVCFLIKAPDARLTATQTYIFHAIMSLFGNDIENNIRTLITFADGKDPPVLASLKESNLPFGKHFTFNNSGLFASNSNIDSFSLSPMFWEMGVKSFHEFFLDLNRMQTKSLTLTKEVLDERQKLEVTIQNLQPQVDAGLAKLSALKNELRVIEQHEFDIKNNKDFEYEVDEVEQVMKELQPGIHVTNCLICNFTCHENCGFADDSDKARCIAMDRSTGKCKQCPSNCNWDEHKNTRYIFQYVTVKKKKTYSEKQKKYQAATGQKLNAEQILEKMYEDFEELQTGIECLMCIVNQSSNRLKEIALRPNPLNMVDHIDLMIESEKLEKKDGYKERINALQEYRKRATISKHVDRLNKEASEVVKGKSPKGKSFSLSSILNKIKSLF